MKIKYGWLALIALTFFGCDDNTGGLGMNMFPDSDQLVNGRLSTFEVITNSTAAERLYAKTTVGYVGKFTDPTFGSYETGFLSELNCPDKLNFPEVYRAYDAQGNEVDPHSKDAVRGTGKLSMESVTTTLSLWYTNYFGNPQTPCRLSVYKLNKKLDKNTAYYTNIDPTGYYNPDDLLGTKAYTAVDLSVSDSIKSETNYSPAVHLTLDKELGIKFIEEAHKAEKNNIDFSTVFPELFPGIYVQSDYGDGTVLYVDLIQLNVKYKNYVTDSLGLIIPKKYAKDENGNPVDSTADGIRSFIATREIIQANQIQNNEEKMKELIEDTRWTYLKTPAGIFTEATLPLNDIYNTLKEDTLNAVKLTFTNYNQESDQQYGMTAPTYVLLVREQDKTAFFEKNMLTDEITSYLSQHNATATNQYVFSNLTKLVTSCLAEKEAAQEKAGSTWNEKEWMEANPSWNKVVLIPVLVTYDSSQSSSGQPNIISIQHDLKPGYARLKGGNPKAEGANKGNALTLEVISTNFDGPLTGQ